MKQVDYNNSSSLVVDNIKKVGNRINFTITALLYDEGTDTNIRFETNSYVIIDDWQQKSEILLTKHVLESENFSFHVVPDQRYYWDTNKISNLPVSYPLYAGCKHKKRSCVQLYNCTQKQSSV